MFIFNIESIVFLCFTVNLVVGKPELRIKKLTTEQRSNLNKICGGIEVTKKRSTGSSGQFKMFGNKAIPKEFPWSVRLHFYGTKHPKTFVIDYQNPSECSGVLITQQHLLTASHCFFPPGRHSTLWNENPLVYVDRVNMENAPQVNAEYVPNDVDKTYKIVGIKFHPCYKINKPINHDSFWIASHSVYDIVIAQLDRALDHQLIDQELALPACLPTSRENGTGKDISFSGFGSGSLEWSLMEKVGCDYRTSFLYPFIMCYTPTGRLYHDDPGDSGGGLIQKGAKDQWHVIGVYAGLRGPLATLFDGRGYGRIYSFIPVFYNLDWINKEVGIELEKL